LAVALLPAVVTGWAHPRAPTWSWTAPGAPLVSLEAVVGWAQPTLLLDARSTEAYLAGHMSGALPLNGQDWDRQVPALLAAWHPGTRLVVYCDGGSCDASQAVALRIERDLRMTDVYVLDGGWKPGIPVRKASP
jgi:rhodanese-related sulfurtransferase